MFDACLPGGETSDPPSGGLTVATRIGGLASLEADFGDGWRRHAAPPGCVDVQPAGAACGYRVGATRLLGVHVAETRVAELFDEEGLVLSALEPWCNRFRTAPHVAALLGRLGRLTALHPAADPRRGESSGTHPIVEPVDAPLLVRHDDAPAPGAGDNDVCLLADALVIELLGALVGGGEPDWRRRLARARIGAHGRPPRLDDRRLARVVEHVEDALAETLTLDALAAVAEVSRFHFAHAFRDATGLAPHRYVMRRRLHRAAHELTASARPIADIALDCGFSSASHLARRFREASGTTPGTWRATGRRWPSAQFG